MTVLKIGGSVLTHKSEEESLDDEAFEDVVDAVSEADSDPHNLILVHGAGSFGHPQAERGGLKQGTHDARGVHETHSAVSRLNSKLVGSLIEGGVDAVSVHPFSCTRRDENGLSMMTDQIESLLDEGFTPVLHGDCTVEKGRGVSVVSGDALSVEVSRVFDGRLGMCTSAGGVLDSDGEVVDRVTDVSEVDVFDDDATDVTGGIRNKVEEILRLKSGGYVFGRDELRGFLSGGDVGTLIKRSE
ncbi:isopentenyl phosphate kinase [Halorutilales archaeon Cl-col2-1]